MKKSIKLLIMAMLALLCTAGLGVSAVFAEQGSVTAEKSLSIDYANLQFESDTYILFAVDSVGIEDRDNIKLLAYTDYPKDFIYEKGEEAYCLDCYAITEIEGKEYTVFCFDKFSAKQMTDNIYVCAYYNDNGTAVYSEPFKYSVVQYCKNVMYKDGVDQKLVAMLNGLLAYGASAQTYYNYNISRLTYNCQNELKVLNGRLEDGFDYGIFAHTEEVGVYAIDMGDEHPFEKWYYETENNYYTDNPQSIRVGCDATIIGIYTGINAVLDITCSAVNNVCIVNNQPQFTAHYVDGTKEVIPYSRLEFIGEFDYTTVEDYSFAVKYNGFIKEFNIFVKNLFIEDVTTSMEWDEYFGKYICIAGEQPTFYVKYNDGSIVEKTYEQLDINGGLNGGVFDYTTPGDYQFYVDDGNFHTSGEYGIKFDVHVVDGNDIKENTLQVLITEDRIPLANLEDDNGCIVHTIVDLEPILSIPDFEIFIEEVKHLCLGDILFNELTFTAKRYNGEVVEKTIDYTNGFNGELSVEVDELALMSIYERHEEFCQFNVTAQIRVELAELECYYFRFPIEVCSWLAASGFSEVRCLKKFTVDTFDASKLEGALFAVDRGYAYPVILNNVYGYSVDVTVTEPGKYLMGEIAVAQGYFVNAYFIVTDDSGNLFILSPNGNMGAYKGDTLEETKQNIKDIVCTAAFEVYKDGELFASNRYGTITEDMILDFELQEGDTQVTVTVEFCEGLTGTLIVEIME